MSKNENDYVLQIKNLRHKEDYLEAAVAVKKGLISHPKSLRLYIENASLAMDELRYEDAITIWDDLIHLFQKNIPVGVYIRKSVAYRKLGMVQKSREIIDLLINNNNANLDVYLEGGVVSNIKGDWDTAIHYYKKAKEIARLEGDKLQLDLNIITVLINAERFNEARSNIRQLLCQHSNSMENLSIKEVLAKLCKKEVEKAIGDPWEIYWKSRKEYIYLHVCKQIIKIVGSSATTIVDVGSNRTPILEFLPMVENRYSVDPQTPYENEGIISVFEDFLLFSPPPAVNFQLGTCLQVMEHVSNPYDFAQRLLSVCEVVLISVPYLEPPGANPGHIHSMINLETIEKWFGKSPNFTYVAVEMSGDERIICLFDNKTDRKYSSFNVEHSTALQFKFRWSLNGSGLSEKDK